MLKERQRHEALRARANRQGGFTFLELVVVLLLLVILVAVVVMAVTGVFGSAVKSAFEADRATLENAVQYYIVKSDGLAPTANGHLPPEGEYAPIDFSATYTPNGMPLSFHPHFIIRLPRHWDEGVWRIDSAALVSIDIDPNEY